MQAYANNTNNIFRASSTPCVGEDYVKTHKYLYRNFYSISYYDNSTVEFSCMYNYHRVSGDMVVTCLPNGTWYGTPPRCEVDYYKEKIRLSAIIFGVSLVIPCILLFLDFVHFVHKRHSRRSIFVKLTVPGTSTRIIGLQSPVSKLEMKNVISQGHFRNSENATYLRSSSSHAWSFNTSVDLEFSSTPHSADKAKTKGAVKVWYEPTRRAPSEPQTPPQFASIGCYCYIHIYMYNLTI
ncbi:hypothetical protein ElyMa_002572300 [Elysia marginata]|uniref:Sushi domain-containing protein n=1 Tax=Elysia marginata TaxID=1093978 RepID=A0AAV4H231_9GAST|nr:hypothetical protein ElyMa_002572300 [Elysia marginata]